MNRNKVIWLVIIAIVIVAGALFVANESKQVVQPQLTNQPNLKNMLITSNDFQNNSGIPKKFSCEGQGINPELNFSGVPANAKSLALIVHDPDAPISGGFTHWVVFNIDPQISSIAQNSTPAGATQGTNGAGKLGYMGPCPSVGPLVHNYNFTLYALDQTLNLPTSTIKTDLEKAIQGHIIAEATFLGTYQMSNRTK